MFQWASQTFLPIGFGMVECIQILRQQVSQPSWAFFNNLFIYNICFYWCSIRVNLCPYGVIKLIISWMDWNSCLISIYFFARLALWLCHRVSALAAFANWCVYLAADKRSDSTFYKTVELCFSIILNNWIYFQFLLPARSTWVGQHMDR